MSKPVGGRGKRADYETTHVRVPMPIKSKVEQLIEEFRSGGESKEENPLTSLEDALKIAQEVLKQKKSARVSLEKVLTALYKTDVKL